jgi:hypothetical protein
MLTDDIYLQTNENQGHLEQTPETAHPEKMCIPTKERQYHWGANS